MKKTYLIVVASFIFTAGHHQYLRGQTTSPPTCTTISRQRVATCTGFSILDRRLKQVESRPIPDTYVSKQARTVTTRCEDYNLKIQQLIDTYGAPGTPTFELEFSQLRIKCLLPPREQLPVANCSKHPSDFPFPIITGTDLENQTLTSSLVGGRPIPISWVNLALSGFIDVTFNLVQYKLCVDGTRQLYISP